MRTELFIAKRYLFAKKSHNVINIISLISAIGIMVSTMGLIIVLSVFNGFSNLVVSLYNSFDPDIKITALTGKTFEPAEINSAKLKLIEGVSNLAWTIEENALIKFSDRQFIATIKGVDENFFKIAKMNDKLIDGSLALTEKQTDYALVGGTIAYSLSLSLTDPYNVLTIYVPKKGKPVSILNPEEAFNIRPIRPGGVFAIQQDFDSKYVLVPLRFAREIIGYETRVSSLEIGLSDGADEEKIRDEIQSELGKNFEVRTRLQQHDFLYRILKTEKWAVYFILSFILIIAIFNIIGSLTMLIIEKKKDISILTALGAEKSLVRKIFLYEGMMVTMSGALTGLFLGSIICLLQQKFGIIKLENGESFLIDAYPVDLQLLDFVYVLLIVFVIGWIASLFTSKRIEGSVKIQNS
ncbi:MAG TPA: ABC transporter permease [Bacteroidia bacterium]|nr:ABC transporter permease [Bacteroidia bacterium]